MKVILTGASGMVGEGVLHECLNHPDIEKVLVIGRRPIGLKHPRLNEIILKDLYNLEPIRNEITGYDSCLFCLGISSVGLDADDYFNITYTLTTDFARVVADQNPGMTFCYISGAATDSSEKGKIRWARVKGKTENDLMKLPFKAVYNFRPGYLHPTRGLKNTKSFYKYIAWMYPVIKRIMPNSSSTLAELGQAMINAIKYGYNKNILEVKDIKLIANQRL